MRRRLASLALPLFVLAWTLLGAPPARGAQGAAATLTLVSQSVWNGATRPLTLSVRATNTSNAPIATLAISLTIWAPARSRIQYDESLKSDVTGAIALAPTPFLEQGTLGPGQSRIFRIRVAVDGLATIGSALYPIRVQLLSDLQPVATLRTPMIFLTERPKLPLDFTWTWVLAEPLQIGPDGVFVAGPIERDIAGGGRLFDAVQALAASPAAADVAVSPVLLDQLERMSRGYRILRGSTVETVPKGAGGSADAQALLGALGAAVRRPRTELVSLPFADPSLPALTGAGLGKELRTLVPRGRDVARLALSRDPTASVVRPPGALLDVPSLTRLARMGTRIVLLDPGAVAPPAGEQLTPPPIAPLAAGNRTVDAILPDERLAATIADYRQAGESVLAAHAALGELAALYFEEPGTPGRGAAVVFVERSGTQPAFAAPFSSLVRTSPWLHMVTATGLVRVVQPQPIGKLIDRPSADFDPAYVSRLERAKVSLRQFASSVQQAQPTIDRMDTNLLLAESGTALANPALGDQFVSSVAGTVDRTFKAISLCCRIITLTSLKGVFLVTVRNDSAFTVKVKVRLLAGHQLSFAGGAQEILIPPNAPRLTSFPVRAETTGRFPVEVQVLAPAGETIAESQMIVRSTAYNRVALILTVGAALFLLFWWGRRFLPRPKS